MAQYRLDLEARFYTANINWARRFRCEENNVELMRIEPQ